MSRYSPLERGLARALEKFPRLRTMIKEPYKKLAYRRHREDGFTLELDPRAELLSPWEWAGMEPGEWAGAELFFGYYDKSPWTRDMSRLLYHRIRENRVEIVVLKKGAEEPSVLGESRTWNSQQGAMAQWLDPDRGATVIFNRLRGRELGARIVDDEGYLLDFIPFPVQTIRADRQAYLSLNYRRLAKLRPDYGYFVDCLNFKPDQAPGEDGLWAIEIESGRAELIYGLDRLAALNPHPTMTGAAHKVNHAIYGPRGDRFVFMHRWLGADGKHSRLYLGRDDGSEPVRLMDDRFVSHYHWRGADEVVVYGRTESGGDGYYLINVDSGETRPLGRERLADLGDGHCTFSPNGRLLLTDTYPDRARQQRLLIYDPQTKEPTLVGRFLAPPEFDGTERCDLHPRFSPDGRLLSIDSAHPGRRSTFIIELGQIISV